MRARMKVARDEPGQALILERAAAGVPAGLAGLMAELVGGVLDATGTADDERTWVPHGLRAERAAGALEIHEAQIGTGRERNRSIPVSELEAITVRLRYAGPTSRRPDPTSTPADLRRVEVDLRARPGAAPAGNRVLLLSVEGVETRQEVADLAYRLGAAAGLGHARVVRNDPLQIQIELVPGPGPGTEPLPSPARPADYARDLVDPAAARAAAEERVPAFDPARFGSAHRVTRWAPGEAVRLDKPLEGMAFGCLPVIVAGLLAGPLVFWAGRQVGPTAVIGIAGLLIAALAFRLLLSSLPRRVVFDWRARRLTTGGWLKREQVPFTDLGALEVRCLRRFHQGSRGNPSYNNYWCEVLAHVRQGGAARTVPLVDTDRSRGDSVKPYEDALPLATELAAALGVERRVTDYE